MQLTPLYTTDRILSNTRKLGVEVPAPVAAAEKRAAAVSRAAGDIMPKPGELIAAIVAAVDEGKDLASDGRVARALQGQALANNDSVRHGLLAEAGAIVAEALAEHHEELIEAWRVPFDTAATALAAAHKTLGDINLGDTDAVVRMGPKASVSWAAATNAVATITTISRTWHDWAEVTRRAPAEASHSTLRIAEVDWETWREEKLGGAVDPWKLARLGIPLDLADPDTYRARKKVHTEAQRAEAAAAEVRRRTGVSQ